MDIVFELWDEPLARLLISALAIVLVVLLMFLDPRKKRRVPCQSYHQMHPGSEEDLIRALKRLSSGGDLYGFPLDIEGDLDVIRERLAVHLFNKSLVDLDAEERKLMGQALLDLGNVNSRITEINRGQCWEFNFTETEDLLEPFLN